MPSQEKHYFCEKCRKTLKEGSFYGTKNLEKYPEGKLKECKECISMHVDNFEPDTYVWILQECDVPYVPKEWFNLLSNYGKDKRNLTGMTILGRYLAKMRLKQYKDYSWKDTEFLQELENAKTKEAMVRQGYDAAEITEVINSSGNLPPALEEMANSYRESVKEQEPQEDYFAMMSGGEDDFIDDLTEEDKTYLRLKWGKTYKPEEWVRLEQLYEEMMASYDIQGAGHIDTLKLICKTSLKANQLIDIGDVEGFQKMSKVYDSLMKSGKFTAAQNKAENGEFVDSVGELIALCETEGYIERYYIEEPNDKVDLTIQDMQRYTKTLIEEETSLSLMIEKAIRENEKEDRASEENEEDMIIDDMDLSLEDLEKTIRDQDFADFEQFLEDDDNFDDLGDDD